MKNLGEPKSKTKKKVRTKPKNKKKQKVINEERKEHTLTVKLEGPEC
jgi:hypothetical protein